MVGFRRWKIPVGEDTHVAGEKRVADAAKALGEPRLPKAVAIYNRVLAVVDNPSEYLYAAERFVKIFRAQQGFLNKGVDSLDYVRECVRRSFGISQIVPFPIGEDGEKMQWVTDEQINEIARSLVAVGFVLPPNHGL